MNLIKIGIDNYWLIENDYEYEENTSSEILDATKEMLLRISGEFTISEDEKLMLEKYYSLFQPGNKSYNVKTPVCIKFLKENSKVFFTDNI